uniref:Histone H4 n=1 Tax=Lilium davidii var. unicolor TaxID=1473204 RepID=A0A0U5G6L3_LILDA|nr:mgH4 [Lilium davidii var. unicolor]
MSGRGRGARGLGGGGAARHRRQPEGIARIRVPVIRRLAQRGGVKRIAAEIYEEARVFIKVFLQRILKDTITYTNQSGRKTVMPMDVVLALKRRNRRIYGYASEQY